MRAFIVLAALVALPFVASVSQEENHGPSRRVQDVQQSNAKRSDAENDQQCAQVAAHPDNDANDQADQDQEHEDQCGDAPPPPPPPPQPASCGPTVSGTATVSGTVSNPLGVGLSGVCIQAFLNGALVAGAVTAGSGNYTVSVLANGETFMFCAVVPAGSTQTNPAGPGWPICPSGLDGYAFPLTAGGSAFGVNFTIQ